MWNALEYAPRDTRKDNTLPDPGHLRQWRVEAAMWITNQMRTKWLESEFAYHADFDARTFLGAVEECLEEATFDAMRKLEG